MVAPSQIRGHVDAYAEMAKILGDALWTRHNAYLLPPPVPIVHRRSSNKRDPAARRPARDAHTTAAVLLALVAPLVVGAHSGTFIEAVDARHTDTSVAQTYIATSLFDARWDVGAVHAQFLDRAPWYRPATGLGVRVAVIDTGIDAGHPDLEDAVVAWRDFLERRAAPYDDDTHGTHVAGIIGARGHPQPDPLGHYFPLGARGVAPDVELIVAKAMDAEGDGDARHVADAIRWALDPNGDGDYDDGADVINLSIGVELAPPDDDGDAVLPLPVTVPAFDAADDADIRLIEGAIRHAVDAGSIVVVAAGNHEPGSSGGMVTFPGTMPEVITVGAIDSEGRLAAFSNEGATGSGKPDLVAPGILLSTFPLERDVGDSRQDGYLALGGTSMAAPMVAGTVALVLEANPSLGGLDAQGGRSFQTDRIKKLLKSTAEPLTGPEATPTSAGAGALRVDAVLAETADVQPPIAWGRIFVTLLAATLIALIIGLRRTRRRRRAALARYQAELQRRTAAAGDRPDGSLEHTAEPGQQIVFEETLSTTSRSPPATDPESNEAPPRPSTRARIKRPPAAGEPGNGDGTA